MQNNTVFTIPSEIDFKAGGIYSKVLTTSKVFSATLMCMAADTKMDTHSTPRAGLVHIIEGRGEFILEGETIIMQPGVMIKMKPGAEHSLAAHENVAFLLYLYE